MYYSYAVYKCQIEEVNCSERRQDWKETEKSREL